MEVEVGMAARGCVLTDHHSCGEGACSWSGKVSSGAVSPIALLGEAYEDWRTQWSLAIRRLIGVGLPCGELVHQTGPWNYGVPHRATGHSLRPYSE